MNQLEEVVVDLTMEVHFEVNLFTVADIVVMAARSVDVVTDITATIPAAVPAITNLGVVARRTRFTVGITSVGTTAVK